MTDYIRALLLSDIKVQNKHQISYQSLDKGFLRSLVKYFIVE
jgi:hypothetical protein